jgi:hypothetical protein
MPGNVTNDQNQNWGENDMSQAEGSDASTPPPWGDPELWHDIVNNFDVKASGLLTLWTGLVNSPLGIFITDQHISTWNDNEVFISATVIGTNTVVQLHATADGTDSSITFYPVADIDLVADTPLLDVNWTGVDGIGGYIYGSGSLASDAAWLENLYGPAAGGGGGSGGDGGGYSGFGGGYGGFFGAGWGSGFNAYGVYSDDNIY